MKHNYKYQKWYNYKNNKKIKINQINKVIINLLMDKNN